MASDPVKIHGWTALPRDPSVILNGKRNIKSPEPVKVESIVLPDTELSKVVMEYAKKELPEETFNHSMRVYYYGMTVFLPQQRCVIKLSILSVSRSSNTNPAVLRLVSKRRNLPPRLPAPRHWHHR